MLGEVPTNPSLLDVVGDIEMPEIEPQLTGNIFIPVVSMQMQPATPAGYGVPGFTPPAKDIWGQLQDWAEANKTVVIVASVALGAMVLLGGKKR